MDFFASQELARRNTRKLVWLLILTVIVLVLAVYAVILLALGGLVMATDPQQGPLSAEELLTEQHFFSVENLILFATVAFLVSSVVAFSSLFKMQELKKGGPTVATMLGGRLIPANTTQFSERRILNIVEEMSLASGVPVPPVYVMENESGINAFAAGHGVDDAVIGVNRGTIEKLNREELQGVIAHEFSHILNGDMRMSLRMIGLLYGIQAIAIIGLYMFRVAAHMSHGRSNEKGGNPAVVLFFIGAGLLAIGSVGLFFARLIKASISRQREYLADASAVQFTRLPEGIGGALKMIGVDANTSKVSAPDAESISHMFFANMYGSKIQSFFATHPPLIPRIQKVEPRFTGDFQEYLKTRAKASIVDRKQEEEEHQRHLVFARKFGMMMGRAESGLGGLGQTEAIRGLEKVFPMDPVLLIGAIGSPKEEDVVYSQILLKNVMPKLLDDCHEMFTARCIVFASILDKEEAIRNNQLDILLQREGQATVTETLKQEAQLDQVEDRFRLPIFEIIQGTLSSLSQKQLAHFEETLKQLILADQQVDLFEFFLLHHLIIHIRRHLGIETDRRVKYETLASLGTEVETLMSVVATVGHTEPKDAEAAFNAGREQIPELTNAISFRGQGHKVSDLFGVMQKLSQASPKAKKAVLTALGIVIIHDQKITVSEAELFRAIAESLDCPVPPVLATV